MIDYTINKKKVRYGAILGLVLALFLLFTPEIALAEDLENWVSRVEVYINNLENSNPLTDFPVNVEIEYKSSMLNDFDDIRFIDSDETTFLDYGWEINDDGTEIRENGVSATAVVEVPAIPANSAKTIYLYYNNPSAPPVADLEGTIDWFDHFTTDRLDEYSYANATIETGDSRLAFSDNAYFYPTGFSIKNADIRVRTKSTKTGTIGNFWGISWRWTSADNCFNFYTHRRDYENEHVWYKYVSSVESEINSRSRDFLENVYYFFQAKDYETSHELNFDTEAGRSEWDVDTEDLNNTGNVRWDTGFYQYIYIDYLYIRKNTKPFPTTGIIWPLSLDNPPTITSPVEDFQALGNIVNIKGECYYPESVEISEAGGSIFVNPCIFAGNWKHKIYQFSVPIIPDYTTTTPGGYVFFDTPESYFASEIRDDANDVRIVKMNNETGTFTEADLPWWTDAEGGFKFYADEETDIENPVYSYFLEYNYPYETEPADIIEADPGTDLTGTFDYENETRIKGNYDGQFVGEAGSHNVYVRSRVSYPTFIFSDWSDTLHIILSGEAEIDYYIWSNPALWYKEHSDYETPTKFLQYFLETSTEVFSPVMLAFNKFSDIIQGIDIEADTDDLSNGFLTLLAYTRLLDDFCGSLPITWGILLLFSIWILKILLNFITLLIQTLKPV